MMNILHTVEYYEPHKGGAEEVIKQLSERLVKRGHKVTVATSVHPERNSMVINGVGIKQFPVSGNQVKGVRGERDAYRTFLINSDFDVIFNYAAQTWTTDEMFSVIDRITARKVIAPLGYSRLHHPRYRNYFRDIPDHLKKYDRLIYTSPNYRDIKFGEEHGLGEKAVVVPNGASLEEFHDRTVSFKKHYNIDAKYMFITVANHYLAKGHKMVIDAFRAADTHDAVLVIIGERPNRHSWYSCYPYCYGMSKVNRNIKVFRGVPREFVVSAYNEADLFLFGSKVECAPLVMYESFASHTPFITTDVGNVKDHTGVIRLVSGSEDMKDEIVRFLRDPELYTVLANDAYDLFLRNHTWEVLTERYENIYRSLLN
jgi:L-malate glycosyltransferase